MIMHDRPYLAMLKFRTRKLAVKAFCSQNTDQKSLWAESCSPHFITQKLCTFVVGLLAITVVEVPS